MTNHIPTVLRTAAEYIRANGLYKGNFFGPDNAACAYGACRVGLSQVSRDFGWDEIDTLRVTDEPQLNKPLQQAALDLYPDQATHISQYWAGRMDDFSFKSPTAFANYLPRWLVGFNDDEATTAEQVIELLEHAAKYAEADTPTETETETGENAK